MFSWKKRIYADAAAATPPSGAALKEMLRLLPLYGNPGGLHAEAVAAKRELDAARDVSAASIGAHAHEVVFVASGTEANNLAITGVLLPLLLQHKNVHAVTTAVEHPSVLEPLRALVSQGLRLTELPVDSSGLVDAASLGAVISDDTALVSVQLINSEVGTVQPIRDIAKEIRRIRKLRKSSLPLYIHTDAAQAPLWLPLAVEHLGVDLLTLDGQKILGPKGVGMLYVKRGVQVEPLLKGGGQERGLRSGTENVLLVGAFAVALAHAQKGATSCAATTAEVRDFLWQEIRRLVPDAVLLGPALGAGRVANNVNISIAGLDGQMAVIALDAMGIAASTRSACSEGDDAPSPTLLALGVSPEVAKTAVRLTLLPNATKQDAMRIASALEKIAQRYRSVV